MSGSEGTEAEAERRVVRGMFVDGFGENVVIARVEFTEKKSKGKRVLNLI